MYSYLPADWGRLLSKKAREALYVNVDELYSLPMNIGSLVYPSRDQVFRAFCTLDLKDVKVVIMGQDPYVSSDPMDPTRGLADGIAFSAPGQRPQPSLQNLIYNLWESGLISRPPRTGNLEGWIEQGILLLNTALTVEAVRPASAKKHARWRHQAVYQELLAGALQTLDSAQSPPAFLFLGNEAKEFRKYVSKSPCVIEMSHPSRQPWPKPRDTVQHPFLEIEQRMPNLGINWGL